MVSYFKILGCFAMMLVVVYVIKNVFLPDISGLTDVELVKRLEIIIMFIIFTSIILKELIHSIASLFPNLIPNQSNHKGTLVKDIILLFLSLFASIFIYVLLVKIILPLEFMSNY